MTAWKLNLAKLFLFLLTTNLNELIMNKSIIYKLKHKKMYLKCLLYLTLYFLCIPKDSI